MIYYYKAVDENSIITHLGTQSFPVSIHKEITETEYNNIINLLNNRPESPDGCIYVLKNDLTWELRNIPTEEQAPKYTLDEAAQLLT